MPSPLDCPGLLSSSSLVLLPSLFPLLTQGKDRNGERQRSHCETVSITKSDTRELVPPTGGCNQIALARHEERPHHTVSTQRPGLHCDLAEKLHLHEGPALRSSLQRWTPTLLLLVLFLFGFLFLSVLRQFSVLRGKTSHIIYSNKSTYYCADEDDANCSSKAQSIWQPNTTTQQYFRTQIGVHEQ